MKSKKINNYLKKVDKKTRYKYEKTKKDNSEEEANKFLTEILNISILKGI